MSKYIAQCKHAVNNKDKSCNVCGNKIERIWNVDKLGEDTALMLAESWSSNLKPQQIYQKEILPYNREEYIFNMCSVWDDENPNANEETRLEAFRNIISKVYRTEYERSVIDFDYYQKIKFLSKGDYIKV